MKSRHAHFALFELLLGIILISGCATVCSHDERAAASNENSAWLDPDASADYDDMTVAQRVAYVVWWPVLEVAKGFCSQSK
jgi:uncharacterized protein YceK